MATPTIVEILNTPSKTPYAILRAIVHPAETGGYWAEILELHCNTDGDTLHEVEINMHEAVLASIDDYPEIADYMIKFEVWDA